MNGKADGQVFETVERMVTRLGVHFSHISQHLPVGRPG